MELQHYLEGQEFLRTANFLLAWFLVIVTITTERLLHKKAAHAARPWKVFLLGVLCISLSSSIEWLHLVEKIPFLQFLAIAKSLKLIGVTFLGIGLYYFLQE